MSTVDQPIDSAAAGIAEERLADVLSLIHREGFGHNAQVIRPERGRMAERLLRAGISAESADRLGRVKKPIVLVFAPSRVEAVVTILRRGGAVEIEQYSQSAGTQSALIGFDPAVLHNRKTKRHAENTPGR